MTDIIVSDKNLGLKPTKPNQKRLAYIAQLDKKPDDCDEEFEFKKCFDNHKKAKTDRALDIRAHEKPQYNKCYGCQLIQDQIKERTARPGRPKKQTLKQIINEVTEETDKVSNRMAESTPKQIIIQKETLTKKCAYCKEEFETTYPTKIYCSELCRKRQENLKLKETRKADKEAEVNEKACEAELIEEEKPVEHSDKIYSPIYYVSEKHCIKRVKDHLDEFNDMIDLIGDRVKGLDAKLCVYLSNDIHHLRMTLETYIKTLA